MNILKLIAQLGLDGRGFKAGMREATSIASKSGRDIEKSFTRSVVGAFGTTAIVAAMKKTIDYGGTIADAAKKSQTHVESLQEEKFWIEQNGGSLEDLTNAYKFLARSKDAALSGDVEKLDIFKALGVDREALANNPLSKTFRTIAETMRTTDFGDAGLPMLEQVLGKVAQQLLPAFSESLSDAAAEAQKLGIVLREDLVNELDSAGDELDKLTARVRGPFAEAFSFALKHIRQMYDFLDITVGGAATYVQTYIEKTKELADGSIMRMLFDSFGPGDSEQAHAAAAQARREHQDEVIAKRMEIEKPKTPEVKTKGRSPRMDSADAVSVEKVVNQRAGLQERLQDATFRVQMAAAKSDESKQRRLLEKQLKEAEDEAAMDRAQAAEVKKIPGFMKKSDIEKLENNALKNDIKAMGIREQLLNMQKPAEALPVNSLTAQGQLLGGGSSVVADGTTKLIQAVEKALTHQKETANATKELNRKITGVVTIVGAE